MSAKLVIPILRKGGEWLLAYLSSITDANSNCSIISWLKRRACCVICHARAGRPLVPPPIVGLQRRRQWVGMISLSHVYPSTPCWPLSLWRGSAVGVVFHAVCAPCTVPGYGQQKWPCRWHGSGFRLPTILGRLTAGCYSSIADCLDFICLCCSPRKRDQRRTVAFERTLLSNEYHRVGKWIPIWMFNSKFKFLNFV